MRIGVIGAAGRMGSTVCSALSEAEDLELVAAVDIAREGNTVGEREELRISASLESLTEAAAEVAVDFTAPVAAVSNAEWCSDHGIHVVIGTTGIGAAALSRLAAAFPVTGPLACLVAPNFAIGAVLMMRFAELAAPWFETAEIIELHHDQKLDAPSGTSMATAERMAAERAAKSSGSWGEDPTRTEVLAGARGGVGPAGVRIHSVRLRGLVAHQEVLLGTAGQSLTIRHDSYDRQSFMPGVLLAVREVPFRPGLTVGLDALLGI
jgi:4-hydroxy-tetrahydrodipicolinate reductase